MEVKRFIESTRVLLHPPMEGFVGFGFLLETDQVFVRFSELLLCFFRPKGTVHVDKDNKHYSIF